MMNENKEEMFCGVILAAGKSSRMGQPKLNLPWKNTTVLGAVVNTLEKGGLNHIFIVINPLRKPEDPGFSRGIEVTWVENADAETEDMLVSIQTGIRALPKEAEFVFICLGDQPTIQASVIAELKRAAIQQKSTVLFPSFRMHRGHPWLVGREHWPEILEMDRGDTIRTFIKRHAEDIFYVNFDSDPPADMDTPEEYQALIRRFG